MLATISSAVGGLGLFLLGMWLMSDGLRNAAGSTLHNILHLWTKNRIRGLSVGFLLTALVQSSSAVTVATIGFTDAGLLKLKRAVWVIFGSNIGTTVTGWLVALIGFNFKISGFALPMIGIGMALKLIYQDKKAAHFGQALVGFGILFLGIDVLKDTFSSLGQNITLISETNPDIIDILLYTGLGLILTTLMQSSSVTLAITLTALSGGVVSLLPAAAVVIGSNLGTTSTAIFSALGSGPVAKRVVASHVLFNVITAFVSLLILIPMINLILFSQHLFTDTTTETTTLALFHTCFNILGVLLMWPIAKPFKKWLSHRFVSQEEDDSKTLYLHKQSLAVHSLALHALRKELQRLCQYVLIMAKDSLNFETQQPGFSKRMNAVEQRILAIGDYTTQIYQQHLPENIANDLPILLRVSRYYDAIAEIATLINTGKAELSELNEDIQTIINEFCKKSIALLEMTNINDPTIRDTELLQQTSLDLETDYQNLKALLLRRGTEGKLSIHKMEKLMSLMSQIRRMNQQAEKAFSHFNSLSFLTIETENSDDELTESDVEETSV